MACNTAIFPGNLPQYECCIPHDARPSHAAQRIAPRQGVEPQHLNIDLNISRQK
jgi:hypothetical protein